MVFEVVNEKGISVMKTKYLSCIPSANQINVMLSIGYKIRIDGKIATRNKIKELLKEAKI